MTHEFAEKYVDKQIEKGADPEKREIMVYGVESTINEIIASGIIFAIAIIIGRPLEMLIWNLFMLPIRFSFGGHHLKTHLACLIYSVGIAVLCVMVYPLLLSFPWLIPAEIVTTMLVSIIIAPYIHPNHPVSSSYRAKLKKVCKIIAATESVIIILLFYFAEPWFVHIAGLGMITASIQCIIGKCQSLFVR